jgi:hypothetical protein
LSERESQPASSPNGLIIVTRKEQAISLPLTIGLYATPFLAIHIRRRVSELHKALAFILVRGTMQGGVSMFGKFDKTGKGVRNLTVGKGRVWLQPNKAIV